MSNILQAINNIFNCNVLSARKHYRENNRANSMGEALEYFVKDSFANSYDLSREEAAIRYKQEFSWLGNANNPPDFILKNGDAIEVKKVQNANLALALNSSYPKSKLYSDSSLIVGSCRNCEHEPWIEKDIIYAVGVVNDEEIKQLCFVYGTEFAASREVYERIRCKIKEGVLEISDIEFSSSTNELGRVNRVDPLGITYLRIRGMWHIENPIKLFRYIYSGNKNARFQFMAIIGKEKFDSFPMRDKKLIFDNTGIIVTNTQVYNPDNPAHMKEVYLIMFSR